MESTNKPNVREILSYLRFAQDELEGLYEETGGEVTAETEEKEKLVDDLKIALKDGTDDLGRWLKSTEDKIAALKAEKAAADRRIKASTNTMAYIKLLIAEAMHQLGEDKIEGTFYSFAATTSTKRTCDTAALDEEYLELATEAARNAGLPGCIDVALKTNTTRLQEWANNNDGDMEQFVLVSEEPAVRFTKPRKADEEAE